jgi:thiol-disulfide isomerase/thioredoxin
MKQWQLILIAVVLAVVSAVGGYQLQQYLKADDDKQLTAVGKNSIASKEIVGTKVENFSLYDVDGVQRNLSEWQGKVIVLNFWATWCAPCREEVPAFVELQEQYGDSGLQFIGIALQEADEIRDFLKEFNVNYPSLAGIDDVMSLGKQLGNDIGALPYTVILDRKGLISFTRRGPLLKADAEKVIQSLL